MFIFSLAILSYCATVLGEHDAESIYDADDPESITTFERFWTIESIILKPLTEPERFESKNLKYEIDNFKMPKAESSVKVEKIKRTIKDFAGMYLQRVLRKGAEDIESIAEYLRKKLHIKKELVSRTVDELTYSFSAKLKSSFKFISFKLTYNEFEKQYTLLDLVNIARFLLNSVGKSLHTKLFAIAVDPPHRDNVVIAQTILTYNLDFKKQELKHICIKVAVCRPCPAFSDYLASIVNELLKVIDAKFQFLLVKSADLLATNKNLLQTFLGKKVSKWFLQRAKNVGNESITVMREVFRVVRSTLSLRHKMLLLGDGTMKKETKALRILIDIIDIAFERTANNYLAIQYGLTASALQDWVQGTRADIDDTLSVFINYVASTLTMALSDQAKKEMKVLSELFFDGEPSDPVLAEDLLENGSEFVRGLGDAVSINIWDTEQNELD